MLLIMMMRVSHMIRCRRTAGFLAPPTWRCWGLSCSPDRLAIPISVMVPDCLLPPVDNMVRIDLRHHVGLSLTRWSPEAHLDRALCPGPLLDTLELQRRDFWAELSPILKQWKCVNGSKCPDCGELIKINMGRHIRLKHTTYQCFWRCPVLSCSLWFKSELNAKDHIEGIHPLQGGTWTLIL